jgi:hypothetical protein
MLKIEPEINVKLKKNTPTKINVGVKSEFTNPKLVTISSSCGCTTASSNFTIEPFTLKVVELTINRSLSGNVSVSFITDGKFYTTKLNIIVE